MANKKIIFLLNMAYCLIFIASCNKDNEQISVLNQLLKDETELIPDSTKALLIIPNSGCDGCISSAEQFVVDNIHSLKGIKVVFTGISSEKALRINLGIDIVTHSNVLIDSENQFYEANLINIYPVIAYLNDGQVTELFEQSPTQADILDNLLSRLTN